MRLKMRLALFVCIIIGGSMLFSEYCAFAQCPPGTHWSNRYWQCVQNRRLPPPPPPPPPRGVRSCNRSYQNCLMVCGGVPECINNCNVGYGVCQQRGGR